MTQEGMKYALPFGINIHLILCIYLNVFHSQSLCKFTYFNSYNYILQLPRLFIYPLNKETNNFNKIMIL